jgi:hypothetical protein
MKKKLLILFLCIVGMFENNHPLSKKFENISPTYQKHLDNLEKIKEIKQKQEELQRFKLRQQQAEATKNIHATEPRQDELKKTGFWAGIAAKSYSFYEYLKGVIVKQQKSPTKETLSVNEK